MILPRLLVLTDRSASRRPLRETVEGAVSGGARGVVFREKELPVERRETLAIETAAVVARVNGCLIVASDFDLASRLAQRFPELTVGIHLASSEARPTENRRLTGRSCHDHDELKAATEEGVDYATLSPVAPSSSKPGYGPALGPKRFAQVVATVEVPVFALGGVDTSNAGEFLRAGAYGVAVMGAVMGADDPGAVTTALLESIGERV